MTKNDKTIDNHAMDGDMTTKSRSQDSTPRAAAGSVVVLGAFLDALGELRLTPSDHSRVSAEINRLRNNPAAVDFDDVPGAPGGEGFRLMTIPQTTVPLVAVVAFRGPVCAVLWLGARDSARAWTARRRFEFSTDDGISLYEDFEPVAAPEPAAAPRTRLFDSADDETLRSFHVPDSQIPFLRSLVSVGELDAVAGKLPYGVYERLLWFLRGDEEDAVDARPETEPGMSGGCESIPLEPGAEQDDEPGMVVEFRDEPGAANYPGRLVCAPWFAVVGGEAELEQIMQYPLDKWRVFLHPKQRKLVEKNYAGPARVLGGAGTGKTVVAMHRARRFARELVDAGSDKRVLFTTFTANLAADVADNLRKICSEAEYKRIEVINLDAWVARFMREINYHVKPVYGATLRKLWDDAIDDVQPELPFDRRFYQDEWERVALAYGKLTKNSYLNAPRVGRGTRLDRAKKLKVWKVFEAFINLSKSAGVRDIGSAMIECADIIREQKRDTGYAHVVVDEAQDLGNPAFRLLRQIAGDERANDLFIVGDGRQRIYKNRPVLSKCDVNVRGRSSNLKINYRTTEETRRFAYAVLEGLEFDDLDDGKAPGGPCLSLTHGPAPSFRRLGSRMEEIAYINEQITRLREQNSDDETSLSDFCVVARDNANVEAYCDALAKLNPDLEPVVVAPRVADDRRLGGVRFATMHRVKGLEFKYVFLAGVNADLIPLKSAGYADDPVSVNECLAAERRLLYVALTRAQKAAFLSGYGEISPFLKDSSDCGNE